MRFIIAEDQLEYFANTVRRAMAEKGLLRKELADQAAVGDGVVGKVLAGKRVKNNTAMKIARALGIEIGQSPPPPSASKLEQADEDHGAYLRSEVEEFIGHYVGYRRTFDEGCELFRTLFEFSWNKESSRLEFIETQRVRRQDKTVAHSHKGGIHLSRRYALVQLLTRFQGAVRLITLHRPPIEDQNLRGVVLTQAERRIGSSGPVSFVPGVSPLFLKRASSPIQNTQVDTICGVVPATDPEFDQATRELRAIETNYLALPLE